MSFSLMIHGGAGTRAETVPEPTVTASLNAILAQGRAVLEKGGSALDAVTECVRLLEDDPIYNAGRGAIANANGDFELDAAVMNGATLEAGAVACVRNIKNPVLLARQVMEKTNHVVLAGPGAEAFARTVETEFVTSGYFSEAAPSIKRESHGTAGAVARDLHGNLAAATSTGGWSAKMPGRIGDTPLIGSGTYADNAGCAVSCTGHGELFIRANIAAYTSFIAEKDECPAQEAAQKAIQRLVERLNGTGGLIAVDKAGNVGCAQSSPYMRYGFIENGGESHAAITSPYIIPV